MKISRIITETGETCFACQAQSGWVAATGSLESGWSLTDQVVDPKQFLPPVDPKMIFAIGLNYREHADEMDREYPEYPVVFAKPVTAAIGHGEPVLLPRFLNSDSVDYEVELAVVIGKRGKNIPKEEALDYVAGYTVGNDVSARDWQKRYGGGQWVRGKGFDTFCPLGPALVTPDEVPDPNALNLKLELNGDVKQSSNTADMIFDVQTLIAFLSGSTTLLPGTIILTGTPPGVGMAGKPPCYLKAGDHMDSEIESIGRLENPIEDEQV